jgi:multimeric flavodoxin WrbA
MKVTVLHGSQHRGKNSDTLTDCVIEGLNKSGSHIIEHFYINDLEISPCQGCLSCKDYPNECNVKDDMQAIYRAYRDSNLIIWASPMYWGYITAQLKLVQDRMEALAWSGFENKTFAVLFTYRHHYQSAATMFKRIAPHFKIDLHILECRTYDPETKRDVPIYELPEKLDEAYRLGVKLSKILK